MLEPRASKDPSHFASASGLLRAVASPVIRWVRPAVPTSDSATLDTLPSRAMAFLNMPQVKCMILSLIMTALLTSLGMNILNDYRKRSNFHFDSCTHRFVALKLYQMSGGGARWSMIGRFLQEKDTLDLVLRLLLYPRTLTYYHGHLYVQVPFMFLFFCLTQWYVYRKTQTFTYGVAAQSVVFLFTTVYHPVQGLLDFWKDNLAVWLLGSAIMSWFLSEGGSRRGWGCLCGVLVSLLALQRVVVAIYGTAIFIPFLVLALVQRICEGDWRRLRGDVVAFGTIPLIVASFMVITQAKSVIYYYFVLGYAYSTPSAIARWLWTHQLTISPSFRYGVLAFLLIPALALFTARSGRLRNILAALWPIFAFLAMVIATKAMYHSYSAVLLVLSVTAVIRLVPSHLPAIWLGRLSAVLFVLAAIGGMSEARRCAAETEHATLTDFKRRETYQELGNVLLAKPEGSGIGIFFDECLIPVQIQLYYDRHVLPRHHETVHFSSVHESFYRANFGDLEPQEIATSILAGMEADKGMVAVVPERPESIATLYPSLPGNPPIIPALVNERITRHIQASPRWQAIRYIPSEIYGPLLVFQLSEKNLTPQEKWASLTYRTPVTGLNISAAVAPDVRQLYFSTPAQSPTEWCNGGAFQWITPGERGGISFSLLTDKPQEVLFRAGIVPGPSRSGKQRSVVVRQAGLEKRFEFFSAGELNATLLLQPGLNVVEVFSGDEADLPPPAPDSRLLMFKLDSPHLLPLDHH